MLTRLFFFLLLSPGFLSFVIITQQSDGVDYGVCNKTTQSTGKFSSPGYPDKYPTAFECLYFFEAPPGSKAQVQVRYFDSEPCCDYLEVFDGDSTASPKFPKKLNGHLGTISQTYTASQGPLTVRFVSDYTVTYSGFDAYFTTV